MAGRIENLKPFKPGQSGNPKGKAKGTVSITTVLRNIIEKRMKVTDPITSREKKLKIKEILALSLVKKAMLGDVRAMEAVLERLEGKAVQPVLNADYTDKEFRDEFFGLGQSGTGAAKQ